MPEYSVYLVEREGSQGGERQVTSPVSGTDVDFYDSGVWLTHETGRNFFPYDEIRTIREHDETRRTQSGDGHGERESAEQEGAEEDLLE